MQRLVDEMKRIAKQVQRKVKESVLSGRCLQCGNKAVKRGVCNRCYMRWWYMTRGMTNDQRQKFDDELTRTGSMLRGQEIREMRRDDAFSQIARKVASHG